MKEHSFPVILEQVCMVLVFAVAAAICLRVFAAADRISQENECMSKAVLFVQNTAEQLKGCNGDPESVLDYTGEILLVGISYELDSKKHQCIIEKYEKCKR